ncbi:MAG TPA: outer membrane protein [Xanthobacteraceae bacterium]|nr:outer membrane protein [Xanthobacteraceae bacterium]
MRSICKTVPTIGVLALLFSGAANAADLGRYPASPPLLQSAPVLVDEFSSGWYLRGDIGYRFNDVDDVINLGSPPRVRDHDLSKTWMFGAGVGYKWEWFRADLTVDYGTRSDLTGDSGIRKNDFSARIDSVTGLVNVYGDLGTWFGFTPYLGAGIGFSHLQAANFGIASDGLPRDADSAGSWNLAWAYMAGVSYRLMGNIHIDAGYRHVNMGDVTTGKIGGNKLLFKDMSADEIRVGVRYTLD